MLRLSHRIAVAAVAVVITAGLTGAADATPAAHSSNPGQVSGPGIITIEQLNMCLWGKTYYAGEKPPNDRCLWSTSSGSTAAEAKIAAAKRASMIKQISLHKPDVITVNEGCQNDVLAVAAAAKYQVRYFDTGSAPDTGNLTHHVTKPARQCSAARGDSVNAILAKTFTDKAKQATSEPHGLFDPALPHGYFPVQAKDPDDKNVLKGSYRSYLCAQVATAAWPSVRVCTAHLSRHDSQNYIRPAECAYLRDKVLAPSTGYTLFAGDVNAGSYSNKCLPSDFHGLTDQPISTTTPGTQYGLQDIYYSAGFWRESCGWAYDVDASDHPGFLLELGKTSPNPAVPDCTRVLPH